MERERESTREIWERGREGVEERNKEKRGREQEEDGRVGKRRGWREKQTKEGGELELGKISESIHGREEEKGLRRETKKREGENKRKMGE